MTRTLRAALALLLLTLGIVVAGCGSESGSGADPAGIAPAGSFFYMEATIDPDGSQEEAMRSILADLPGSEAPEKKLGALISKAIEESDDGSKLDYAKDVEPWLGDRIAVFASGNAAAFKTGNVPAGIVVSTTDADAARDAIEKGKSPGTKDRQYNGVEYLVEPDGDNGETAMAVVDGFLVVGSEAGVRAAIDTSKNGRTITKDERFKKAVEDVSDERVGFAYADLPSLIQLASDASGNAFPGGALFGRLLGAKALVITARAEQQALVFEGASPVPALTKSQTASPQSLMDSVPADAWAAIAIPGFGDVLRSGIGLFAGALGGQEALSRQLQAATGLDLQKDLLSWIGDAALFVNGDSKDTISGGVLVKSKNRAASKLALTKIAAAITRQDSDTRVAAARIPGAFGYEMKTPDVPRGVYMVQAGETVAITYGKEAAETAVGDGASLSSAPDFQRARKGLGDGYDPAFYLSAPPILRLAESFGAGDSEDYAKAKPYLTILDYLVAGSAGEGDKNSRLRIGFKPHE